MQKQTTFKGPFLFWVMLLLFTVNFFHPAYAQWKKPDKPYPPGIESGIQQRSSAFPSGFAKNVGQITNLDGSPLPQVRYLLNYSGMKVQLRSDGFSYDSWIDIYEDSAKTEDPITKREISRKDGQRHPRVKESKFHRIDT